MNKGRPYSGIMERRVLSCYYSATSLNMASGLTWYLDANARALQFATDYGVTLEQSSGVIAALSPGSSWDFNLQSTELLLSEWARGARDNKLPAVGAYGWKNIRKAESILGGKSPLDALGGPKVRNFYVNILNAGENIIEPALGYVGAAVTIDRHAKCCLHGIVSSALSIVRPAEYQWLANHYRNAARIANVTAAQFQAVCWVQWRSCHGDLDLIQESLPLTDGASV